jgi:mono/diheme cytochrome c family protein
MGNNMNAYQFGHASQRSPSSTVGWGLRAGLVTAALWTAVLALWPWEARGADKSQIERGRYLVTLGGCGDCHTPGYFLGKPDFKRELGGSEVGFEIPGVGVFYGPNLTPDKETGLGTWSEADIVKALKTGVRPDGRGLVPVMPWPAFAKLTKQDAQAIAAYLKSLPPVTNKVPGPFGANETPTSFVMKVVPPPQAMRAGWREPDSRN